MYFFMCMQKSWLCYMLIYCATFFLQEYIFLWSADKLLSFQWEKIFPHSYIFVFLKLIQLDTLRLPIYKPLQWSYFMAFFGKIVTYLVNDISYSFSLECLEKGIGKIKSSPH